MDIGLQKLRVLRERFPDECVSVGRGDIRLRGEGQAGELRLQLPVRRGIFG